MNFLEGIKRIFLLGSLVITIAAGALGWAVGSSRSQCRVQDPNIQLGQPSLPSQSAKDANPWDNDVLIRPAPGAQLAASAACLKDPGRSKTGAAYAVFSAAVSAVILFAIWLMIRWVFAGFFPDSRRK
ncbi:hypothetical protein [Comamonas sp.]|uniref:hypothetical protein n=1 Tax=Comamonas sp. TaxID=34028 RepID=UPI0028966F10|nr:hypothetical protein [Comamonas sp.]